MKVIKRFVVFALLGVGTWVAASPFSITHNGIASTDYYNYDPMVPGINLGPYSVQLVFDNGGTTAASQTWSGANLTCVIWTFNGGAARFAQNLTAYPPSAPTGSVTTDSSGALTSVFSDVTQHPYAPANPSGVPFPASRYQVLGITLANPVGWYLNSTANVFYTDGWNYVVGDSTGAAGGVDMIPANWSNPTPFNQACSAAAPPAAPIPTLGEWAMLLLASLMAMFGYARLRTSYAGGRG